MSSPAKPTKGLTLSSPIAFNATNNPHAITSPTSRQRNISFSSDSSDSAAPSTQRRVPFGQPSPLGTHQSASGSTLVRPSTARIVSHESSSVRQHSPLAEGAPQWTSPGSTVQHRRQRSQGYFEPTLPSASASASASSNNNHSSNMAPNPLSLNTSTIAAQAAMQVNSPQHLRKRSMTVPDPNDSGSKAPRKTPPPPLPSFNVSSTNRVYGDGFSGGHKLAAATAATTAANVVFPRSPQYSPAQEQRPGTPSFPSFSGTPSQDREVKSKEKSKGMKLFSKPKSIGIIKDKDIDRRHALPSPNKMGPYGSGALGRFANASVTSLGDPIGSSASSIYSSANVSTSTLVPDRSNADAKEKDKHKHNFLTRGKHKLKDKDDHHGLPLSSASSTSRPTDPNAPSPLYSFAPPPSPGHSSSFAKSVSGLDLRHGGRGFREKKKEEKAAAAGLLVPNASSGASIFSETSTIRERDPSFSIEREWPGLNVPSGGPSSYAGSPFLGSTSDISISHPQIQQLAHAFNMPGLGPDDAWPLLKARLLYIFEGEEPRQPVEDFNALVAVWIRRCVQLGKATIVIEDLNELLQTGFSSLDQTLRPVPDDRLVPALVELWHRVFSIMLPFLQAVLLPLDLEFKGKGTILTAREAADKWGARLPHAMERSLSHDPSGSSSTRERTMQDDPNIPTMGEDLDVRRMTLLTYRDTVILPRIDALLAIFSRLSLENLSSGFGADAAPLPEPPSLATLASVMGGSGSNSRPSTAPSIDPSTGSYSSTNTGFLDGSASIGARSRATSNTSAGSFGSIPGMMTAANTPFPPPPSTSVPSHPTHGHTNSLPHAQAAAGLMRDVSAPMDSAKVTEIVGRMLQCVSVLAGVQTGDASQEAMERLAREMKLNWLGRGRTGRQRRGFVGTRKGALGVGSHNLAVEVK